MNALTRFSIAARLGAAFATLFVAMIGLGFFAVTELGIINEKVIEVNHHWIPSIKHTGAMNKIISDFRLKELQHILSTTPEQKAKYDAAMDQQLSLLEEHRKEYGPLVSSPEEREVYDDFNKSWDSYMSEHERVIALSRNNQSEEARDLARGKEQEYFDKASADAVKLVQLNSERADRAEAESQETFNHTKFLVWLFVGVIVVVSSIGAWLNSRSITVPLKKVMAEIMEGATQVASAAGQVSSASQDLSIGASKSAASLEENAASIEELSSSVRLNAQNALEAANLSRVAYSQAEEGERQIARLVQSVGEISQSSKKIEDIIKVIDEIAFQTNLLALNAAVEAARAGDHGKGFAVVAEEVRNLAQRSANSAKDIAALINESVSRSSEGLRLADASGAALKTILSSVKKVADLNGEISHANDEQSKGIAEVNNAIAQLDGVSQQNASAAEQAAAAAEELSAQAMTMQALGAELSRVVSGASARVHTPSPSAPRVERRTPSAPKTPSKVRLQERTVKHETNFDDVFPM